MAYDSTIRQDIFKRMGVYIKWWYELNDMKSTLDTLLGNAITEFELSSSPTSEDKAAYEAFSVEMQRQKDDLESLRQSVVNLVSEFFGANVKALLDSHCSTPEAVLDHLLDAMDDYDDEVLENAVTADATVTEDEDNSVLAADGLSLDFGVAATQMAQDDRFGLICVDDSVVDQERWTLESARVGQYPGEIVTGQTVDWDSAGIEDLLIPVAPVREDEDTSSKVSDWKLSGAIRGTNVTADGLVYLKFNSAPTLTKENDELGQLTNFDFTGGSLTAVFGDESDIDGKLYVSLVKEPAAIDVLGGVVAQISESGLIIDGASDSNTDGGTLYAKVTKSTGSGTSTYTVELYKDSARTEKVASGSEDATEDEIPTAAIALTEYGGSGLTGKVTLSAFASVEDGTDESLLIKVPRYFIRVCRSSARSSDDLVAEGVSYQPKPGGAVDLDPVGDFQTTGTVNLNYIQDNEEIVLSGVFYTIDAYRADPDGADTTDDDIVARTGSVDNLLTGSASDLAFHEVNGSGLTEASVDLAAVTVDGGYVASAYVGFANGDKFTFETSEDEGEAGRFQTFLRDNFGKVFPSVDTEEDIDESWAGAGA